MKDPYLDELKYDFDGYSNQLKRLRQRLLKTDSQELQAKIVKQIDSVAKKMEDNQRQSAKVAKSRIKQQYRKKKRQ